MDMADINELGPGENFAQIKVVGVGGGGGNAVNRMISEGLGGVEFISVNTDNQALMMSKSKTRVKCCAARIWCSSPAAWAAELGPAHRLSSRRSPRNWAR